MGPAGLTAVFGMGTGVTPPVWSPRIRPAGTQATPAAILRWSVTPRILDPRHATGAEWHVCLEQLPNHSRIGPVSESTAISSCALGGGGPFGVVKLLGC